MRTRSLTGILAVLAIVLVALLWFLARRPAAKPAISIGVLSYKPWARTAPDFSVRLGITNTGRITIRYNQVNFSGHAVLRVESHKGWATRDIGPGAVFGVMSALLSPGSNTTAFILLPSNTRRWQITYQFRAACPRDRIMSKIPAKWRGRFRPLCERLFSGREGPEQEIVSDMFELPYPMRPSDHEAPPLNDFDPLSPAPAAWEQ